MQTSESINELAGALAKAQGQFAAAAKDAQNLAFMRGNKASKYADIAAVWEAIRKPLSENGLAVIQQASRADAGVAITTQIIHSSGQWMRLDPLVVPMMKQDAHGVGSATTYGRRFALCAALGIVADEDDDGNAASGKTTPTAPHDDGLPKVKNAPGVSEARKWTAGYIEELRNVENKEAFIELLYGAKVRFIRMIQAYPGVYEGPDGSGLRGETMKISNTVDARSDFDTFIREVELMAKEQA
jgi:hypothetical protein